MKLLSIYNHMMEGAASVPSDENVKIIFRHSIRGKIESGIGREVELTDEGIELARSFGKFLDYNIGFVASSSCKRNILTCKEILYGKGIQKEIFIAPDELEGPQTKEKEPSDRIFEQYNYRSDEIILRLNNKELPGFNSIHDATCIMLDFMFANGNQKKCVDLFCTHDFQMAILYSGLFGFAKTKESIQSNKWPMMLEGMILWGSRNHFWCSWRGEIKEFIKY